MGELEGIHIKTLYIIDGKLEIFNFKGKFVERECNVNIYYFWLNSTVMQFWMFDLKIWLDWTWRKNHREGGNWHIDTIVPGSWISKG